MRHEGNNKLGMLITTLNDGNAVFLQVRIKPEELDKFINEHGRERR